MLWKFEQIRLKGFGDDFPSEWVLKLTTIKEFLECQRLTRPGMIQDALINFMDTTSKKVQRDHFTNHFTQTAALLAFSKFEGTGVECSFLESISQLFSNIDKNQMEALIKGYILYVRDIGSYTFDAGNQYEILKQFQSSEIVYPQSKIRLIQWQGGKHWYAKIGNTDVVLENEQKWNTKTEAQHAATTYLNSHWHPDVSLIPHKD